MNKRAPGPKGLPLIGNVLDLQHDILGLMLSTREQYGDVVRFMLGPRVIHVINHPDLAQRVLVTNRDNYDKTARSSQQIKHLAGMSLLVSNGDDWRVKHRLLQPAFKAGAVTAYFNLMQSLAVETTKQLQDGHVVNMSSFMMHLTYRIVGMAMLSDDLDHTADQVEQIMASSLQFLYQRINNLAVPLVCPTQANKRFRLERRQLHDIVTSILKRRQSDNSSNDLLARMFAAKDSERDTRLNDTWLRDEVVTLLLAGHETTANALSFCAYLLARHPDIQQRVVDELDRTLGKHPLQLDDLDKLPYLHQVLLETMRLYPPIWAVERFVKQQDELGGYTIPAGSTLFISIYAMHRHTKFWHEPERFDPGRFANMQDHAAFMPFGFGPRMCIGMSFALQEAKIILATLLQRFVLLYTKTKEIEHEAGITLRVRGELPIELKLR
jgi:enediyne biosynthesis protein E7